MQMEERFKPIQDFVNGAASGFESTQDAVDYFKQIRAGIKRDYGIDPINLYPLYMCLLARNVSFEDLR